MKDKYQSMVSIVLSGGSGTRLWPVSRVYQPKPFLKLPDGSALIKNAYLRAKFVSAKLLTVTNRDYYFMSRDELAQIEMQGDFLLEPFGRNTATAIALACKLIVATQPVGTIVLILPADQLVSNQAEFAAAVDNAAILAAQDFLVTFGVAPTAPEVGFGYIECGESLGVGNRVSRFIEKPNYETAARFVSSGNFLWNSGMFCFKPELFLSELDKHAPQVSAIVDECWTIMNPFKNDHAIDIPAAPFSAAPDVSVDNAILEKSDRVAVVPSYFDWSDVGSWSSYRDLVSPDLNNNRSLGGAIFLDSTNNFIKSEERLVAAIGINDLMIVDTADVLLVAHSNKSQDVKRVVAQLKEDDHVSLRMHRTVTRPWGTYTVLQEAQGFKIKRIEVKPEASLSLQMHKYRSEHWVVVSGTAKIINGNNEILIRANESTYIPAGQKHRLINPGAVPCVMIEVQCGAYLGEDDIVRFEDVYGRENGCV